MLPKNEPNLEDLANQFFRDELGINPEDVPEAARNLLGAYEVLYNIDERLKEQKV